MAIQAPNYLQTKSYSAKRDRRVNSAEVMREGVVSLGDFKLSQRAAGANMSVDVAAGEAWVKGDSNVEQGFYHVVNDATVNLPISSAHATLPRIDTIVLAVNDSTEVGGSDEYKLEVLNGTATSGATLSNLKGTAAIGANKLLIGYVLVAAAATKVESASMGGLTDPYVYQELLPFVAKTEPYAKAGAPPQYAHGRPKAWVPSAMWSRSGQSIGSGGPVAFEYTSVSMDTEEQHVGVSGSGASEFRCKTPGMWTIAIENSCGVSTTILTQPYINGAGTLAYAYANNFACAGSFITRLRWGDSVQGVIQQYSGSAQSCSSWFRAVWMGP